MNFKFYAINGMDKNEIEADTIELHIDNGQTFELHPRKSDGEISLSAKGRLTIQPRAANLVYIGDIKL